MSGPVLERAQAVQRPRAFEEWGFYVFEGVIRPDELGELQRDMHAAIDGATAARDAGDETFMHNGIEIAASSFGFTTPLSDNSGPTGRSPSAMKEYEPPAGAPDQICRGASYYCRFSEAGVRLYGHPGLLAVAVILRVPGTPGTRRPGPP